MFFLQAPRATQHVITSTYLFDPDRLPTQLLQLSAWICARFRLPKIKAMIDRIAPGFNANPPISKYEEQLLELLRHRKRSTDYFKKWLRWELSLSCEDLCFEEHMRFGECYDATALC